MIKLDVLQHKKTCGCNRVGEFKFKLPKTAIYGHFWAIFFNLLPFKASLATASLEMLFNVIISYNWQHKNTCGYNIQGKYEIKQPKTANFGHF